MNSPIRILFVDDEHMILKTLRRLFMDSEFETLTADSGEEGINILENDPPVHIVVSDYRMPGMNGVEFLRIVNTKWPETVRMVLSGYADTASVVAAINDGQIFKFIAKPWDDDEFKNTITDAAQKYRNQEHNLEIVSAWKLIEALPLALIRIDASGIISWHNEKASEVFGQDVSGKNIKELWSDSARLITKTIAEGEASGHARINSLDYKAYTARIIRNNTIEGLVLVLEEKDK
jgi:YesN/AraC family two-component response regulator